MTNDTYRLHASESMIARWMQIKRLNSGQLLRLHAVESRAFDKEREASDSFGGALAAALTAGCAMLERFNDELGAFWPRAMTESEKEAQNGAFRRHIYPIWNRIWRELEDSKINELQAMHQADRKIHADEYRYPNQGTASGASEFK